MIVAFPFQVLQGKVYSEEVFLGAAATLIGIAVGWWQFIRGGALNSAFQTLLPMASFRALIKRIGLALLLTLVFFLLSRDDGALQFFFSYAMTAFLCVLGRSRDLVPLSLILVFLIPLSMGRFRDAIWPQTGFELVVVGDIDLRFVVALLSAVLIYTLAGLCLNPIQNRYLRYRLALGKLCTGLIFAALVTGLFVFRDSYRPRMTERVNVETLLGNPVSVLVRHLDSSFYWTRPRRSSSLLHYEAAQVNAEQIPCLEWPHLQNKVQWTAEFVGQQNVKIRWYVCQAGKNQFLDQQLIDFEQLVQGAGNLSSYFFNPHFYDSQTGVLHWGESVFAPLKPVHKWEFRQTSVPVRQTGYQDGDIILKHEYSESTQRYQSVALYKEYRVPLDRHVGGLSSVLGVVWDELLILHRTASQLDFKLSLLNPVTHVMRDLPLPKDTLELEYPYIVNNEVWLPVSSQYKVSQGCDIKEPIPVYLRFKSEAIYELVHLKIESQDSDFSWFSLSHQPEMKALIRVRDNPVCGVRHAWTDWWSSSFDRSSPSFVLLQFGKGYGSNDKKTIHLGYEESFVLSQWSGNILWNAWPHQQDVKALYSLPLTQEDWIHPDLDSVKFETLKVTVARRTDETDQN